MLILRLLDQFFWTILIFPWKTQIPKFSIGQGKFKLRGNIFHPSGRIVQRVAVHHFEHVCFNIIRNVEVKTKNNEFLNWHTSYWESLDTWLAIKNWVFNFYFLYFGFWNHCSKAIDKISSIHENTTSKSDHLQECNFTKSILSPSFGMHFVWPLGLQARPYFWGSRVWDIYLCRTFYQSPWPGTLPFHQSISIYMHCERREYET